MISSYLSAKTEVKNSLIEGKGLFAKENIKKGEIIGVKGGHIIDKNILDKYEDIVGESYLQIADDLYLAPLTKKEVSKVMMFLNHSCEPNVGFQGNIILVAMRDINNGEELTFDYAMSDNEPYKMKCKCGLVNCRKIITGKDWKKKDLQKKYGNYFSSYLRDKISQV